LPKSSQKLAEYEAKRNRATTNEPFGAEPALSAPTMEGAFVVHLHDATRRHYDLRLEVAGVLKSFAVPRGPSLDPADKRLAVETEDHPIEYLDFEAVIPEGNYGAGAMIVWDRGRVRYLEKPPEEGEARGKIDFELTGYKLRGRFALVLTGGAKAEPGPKAEWLLLKKQDRYAKPGSIADEEPRSVLSGLTVDELADGERIAKAVEQRAAELGAEERSIDTAHTEPMLCANTEAPHRRAGWIYELKLDGGRILADKQGGAVSLFYRRSRSATQDFPEVVRAVKALPCPRVVLDGEVVLFDENGRPSFQNLSGRFHLSKAHDALIQSMKAPVAYLVFDLLSIGSRDVRALPLATRKSLLRDLVKGRGVVRVLDHLEEDGRPLYEFCRKERLEGMVAKRADSKYVAGPRRTGDWVKIKCERDDEFVVIGWTGGEGIRAGMGALDLASFDENGTLVARGKVGSGLDERSIDQLLERLRPLVTASSPAQGDLEPAPRGRTFVRPEIVVSVRYIGWTGEARLRHPVFRGIRPDVPPAECRAAPHDDPGSSAAPEEPAPLPEAPAKAPNEPAPRRVQLTNPKKIFWPDDGLTKKHMFDYYERISETLLPYLYDRPVVLVRYPDGIAGKNFYQWNVPVGTPSWIRTVTIRRDEDDREVNGFLVNDLDTLLYIANLGCIPIHILAARSATLKSCDFITFDFDIGELPVAHAVTLARTLRELLDEIGLRGYPKTSGQSGLHVLVPMGPGVTFDTARALVDLLGKLLEGRHPTLGTMERRINQRGQRVYIDTGQTGRSRTIVAPYSVRAQKGATVSTPLDWDEVEPGLSPSFWSMASVPERVASRGDPMRTMLSERPDVGRAVQRLGAMLGPRGPGGPAGK
jgi:bifunctional non-homologous end joining protein LigD